MNFKRMLVFYQGINEYSPPHSYLPRLENKGEDKTGIVTAIDKRNFLSK